MSDIAAYKSCEVISCAMKMKGDRRSANHRIAETCRHYHSNECPHKRIFNEQHNRSDAN